MVTTEIKVSKQDLLNIKTPMTLIGLDWQAYEDISEELGDSSLLHLTFNKGFLTFMPVTELHELLTSLLHNFITFAGMVLRVNIVPTGKATIRSKRRSYGVEPDLSYFVSKSDIHQIKSYVPKEVEISPDIVCEIDVYHLSDDKFEIYSEFGVSEFWLFNGEVLKIFKLQDTGEYLEVKQSQELPILNADILSEFLHRGQTQPQFEVLSDFQNWLQENNEI